MNKRCIKCGETKPTTEYYKNPLPKDGLTGACKACIKAYKDTPEVRERTRATHREWQRKRYAEHPELMRAKKDRRQARMNATHDISREQWAATMAVFNRRCAYCEGEIPHRTFPSKGSDHVLSLGAGGKHAYGNVVPCCGPCNVSKAMRDCREWMESQGLDYPKFRSRLEEIGAINCMVDRMAA